MRHRKAIRKIGRPTAHRNALLRNLVTSFFQHDKVVTTKAKAKAAQQVAERLIKYSISGTLEDKRRIISYLKNREVAHKLIKLGVEKFTDAPRGGRTAIYKLGYRKGDGAEMAVLSLLIDSIEKKKTKKHAKKEKVIETAPKIKSKKQSKLAPEEIPAEEKIAEKKVEDVEVTAENVEDISIEDEKTTESAEAIEPEQSKTDEISSDIEPDKNTDDEKSVDDDTAKDEN
ncbi:50S ribosomal protein L17 [bacterium]|nr:50S ribosomal protein L17 [bacterium]